MRRTGILLTLVVGLLAIASPAHADTSDFDFDSFDADYTISQNADGTSHLEVVETIVAVFPEIDQNRGIIRAIPARYDDVDLETTVESIVDETGAAVPYDETTRGGFVELALGTDDFVHGPTTYVISYAQNHVIGQFADTDADEFYWDVNGTGWDQQFGSVSTTVQVDPAVAPALTGNVACYQGSTGSTDTCEITSDTDAATGAVTYAASVTGLDARETLTVAIGFTAGTFVPGVQETAEPVDPVDPVDPVVPAPVVPFAPSDTPDIPLWSGILAILAFLGSGVFLIVAIAFRVSRASENKSTRAIIPQYSVPKGLNVMAAAYVVGRGSTAIPAQIVSLAVRKNIRILDYPVTASGAEYTLQYLTSEGLDALELQFMSAIFGGAPIAGQVRELAPGDVLLGSTVNAVAYAAAQSLSTTGLRPATRTYGCLVPLLALGLIAITVVNFIVSIIVGGNPAAAGVAIFFMLFGMIPIGLVSMSGRNDLTPLGKQWRDYLEGMKLYLTVAEEERFRMLQSPEGAERIDIGDTKQIIKLYEKLLPFAVIWGVEDQWSKELEVRVAATGESPEWFTGRNGFSAIAFTTALRGVATSASYTPPSQRSGYSGGVGSSWSSGGSHSSSYSSHSGGSHGGGHSGGGGGGGGGGGR